MERIVIFLIIILAILCWFMAGRLIYGKIHYAEFEQYNYSMIFILFAVIFTSISLEFFIS